ncbi:uncharacterized protein BDR25DRAFT_96892 [Lindgomyces ingoldianus]|uniref:Uncharacterized protein n=1 Tax=Lindgomyces ingoldianus TaxID=673940 RepID=A0ACB6QBQ5_9PLEO|nr:uncharacterized protein BDR25DRAFT_96892 [Lindgomyces ingoldianus]KAF2464373.1 hypothetical protein BDR25DRAFT_96892 [Lindgomyces ingoldianus]
MSSNKGIRDRTLNCIESFNKCLVNPTLGKLGWVERCQADFNLWTYGLKATSTGKSSLDYRVREREDVRNVICDLLDGMAESLHRCLEASTELEGVEDLEFDIRTVLKQLSRIHVAIRRAGNHLRHQRADAALGDALETEDFIEWKEDMENLILMGIENKNPKQGLEEGRNPGHSQQRTLRNVQERLIRANLLRRHRIQYARSALEEAKRKDAERLLKEAKKHAIEPAPSQPHVATVVIEPERLERKDQGPVEGHPINNPPLSENQQTATDIPSKFKLPLANSRKSGTIITKATQTGREQNYPRWHKDLGAYGNFLCPYCAEPLSRDYINNDIRWRGHLAGDLTPYVCIMDDCKTPDFMFVTTEDLNKHILGEHGCHRWVCNYCANEADELHRNDTFIYDTAEDWVSHVKNDHLPNIPVSQLEELSLLSQRRFIQSMECPLCDVAVSTIQTELDGHIAGHLHSFALRALPWGLSQGSHGSDTPRASARIELESSFVSSRWENLSNQSDVEWPDHDKPAIENWSDWHDMKDEAVIRKHFIENWMRDISDFLASDEEKFHRAAPGEVLQEESTYRNRKMAEITRIADVPENNFNIDKSLHAVPPGRSETPSVPSCAIPFRRDPDFVDHGTLLDQIREKCAAPASRIALVGLGGVGKSQLAIEHCYRTAEASPETWVFWVHASNAARIEQGYRDIADQVRLAGRNDPQADVFKLVHNWLCNEKNGKWLVVLDNADDAAALTLPAINDPKAKASSGDSAYPWSLSLYLPHSKNGSVLVTSRTKSAALQLVEEGDILFIEPMDDASSQELLRTKLGEEVDEDRTAELARALEFMPLALVQAAAYIRQRAPRCSVQQYLEELHKSDRKWTGLLDYDGGRLRRDLEAKNSILITWQISFDHILQARRSAADLLSLMSFFDRQGIPEALLRDQYRTENRHGGVEAIHRDSEDSDSDNNELEASVDDVFEGDINMLRNYSFIWVTTDASTFDMHRLVQLATRKWLEGMGQLETWKQQYINNLCAAFPTGKHENWVQCQALFPHAKSALLQPPKSEESLRQWALLLYNAAWYAWQKGNVGDAEKLSVRSMKVRKKLLGKEHTDTLSSTAMAGLAAKLAGRWKEAEELEVQVMETRKRVLGEEHPDTLISMNNLAFTLKGQGLTSNAISLMEDCCRLQAVVLGSRHPFTISSHEALATWQLEAMETSKQNV